MTRSQDNIIRRHWERATARELAVRLGVKPAAVRRRVRRLGLPKKVQYATWKKESDNVLIWKCETFTAKQLATRLKMPYRATLNRLKYLDAAPLCAVHSVSAIVRDTGYDVRQLKRARDALGMIWRRAHRVRYKISEQQKEQLIEFLKCEGRTDTWATMGRR